MNVNKYKEIEQEINYTRCILESVNAAIVATNEQNIVCYINTNAEKEYGLIAKELIGQPYDKLLKKLDLKIPLEEIQEKLLHSGSCVFEVSFENADGEIAFHKIQTKIIRNESGDYAGTVSTATDITEHKRSEETVNQQNTILKVINAICKKTLSCVTMKDLAKACLETVNTVTKSQLSFIGEFKDDGEYQSLAFFESAGNKICNAKSIQDEFYKLHSRLFSSHSTVLVNDMSIYKAPHSHPDIHSFLCVPYVKSGEAFGLVGVANRDGGYSHKQKEIVEAIAPVMLEALQKKRTEEQVRENELLMRTIMDSASDFIFLKDKDSRIVMVNQAYGRVFNTDIEDVVGKNDYELYPIPKMAAQVIENDKRVMETGETLLCQESAKTVDGIKTFSLSKTPWRNANGEIIGVLGTAHDITELKQIKDSLQETVASLRHSKRYIEILYETTGEILSSDTPREDIEKLCKKVMRFLGCDCFFNYFYEEGEDVLSLNCCYGIPSGLETELKALPLGSAVCGYAVQNKCRVVAEDIQYQDDKKTTELKPLGIRAYACHPLMTDGDVMGSLAFGTRSKDSFKQEELKLMKAVAESVAVSIRRKITEEKLLKQAKELEDKNKLITDFFINLSHEFKTPLSILKLAAELMEHYIHHGELNQNHMIDHINMIKSNANRLTRLVGNLLDMTKVDAGFMSPQMTYLDIAGFLENMVQSIVDYVSKRNLTISFYSNTQSKLIYTDSDFIERIVLNLVSNAIKHTPKGGRISVTLCGDKERVRIAVKDNGEGIPDDKKEIVFDRFRQVNNSLSRPNEGCGIGLALTKSLVELLGGCIWLNSTLGMGSEFIVELPALNIKTDQSINVKPDNLENKIVLEFSDINFD